jgi:hypothetical protein
MSAFYSSEADLRWDDPSTIDTGPTINTVPPTPAYASVVIDGVPTVQATATGTFTVIAAPIAAGESLEIDGVILTATAGAPGFADEFDGSSADPAVVAANITDAINNGSVAGWGTATAVAAGTQVQLTASAAGAAGNSITLSSTSASIIPSNTTLTGGSDQAYLSIGGFLLAANTSRTPGGNDFDINDAGPSIAAAINDPLNSFAKLVTAEGSVNCVNMLAVPEGTLGNGIALATNSSALVLGQPATQGGEGYPCPPGKNNSVWDIIGVNIYRSDTGERGPYYRVNRVPVQSLFYRDRTDVAEVPNEVIPWDGGWIFQGTSPNNKGYRLRTRYRPIVKDPGIAPTLNAVNANAPNDVQVYVDGVQVPVRAVFGPTGEIDLSRERVWDPSTENWVDPPTPTSTSTVVVHYWYKKGPKLENTLDRRNKVFYRVTSVAIDQTGTSPSGLVETPLEYSQPVSPMESEQFTYIEREMIARNRWILEQGGERVKLYIKRMNGIPCDCVWDARLREYTKQPQNRCLMCYGTGWRGGYEGPYDMIVGPQESSRQVTQTVMGRVLENSYEVWIGPSPRVTQYDFIVKQNGERYSIGAVTPTQHRGRTLQQSFTISHLDANDIRYEVPLNRLKLEELPWPETRYTRPEDADCEDAPPYPVGCDPQATPMATEVARIPDNREQRGRTPVWGNITYGGGTKKP